MFQACTEGSHTVDVLPVLLGGPKYEQEPFVLSAVQTQFKKMGPCSKELIREEKTLSGGQQGHRSVICTHQHQLAGRQRTWGGCHVPFVEWEKSQYHSFRRQTLIGPPEYCLGCLQPPKGGLSPYLLLLCFPLIKSPASRVLYAVFVLGSRPD